MKNILPLLILVCLACAEKVEHEQFSVDQHEITIHHDSTLFLTTTPAQNCSWISENEGIATVSSSGLIKGGLLGDTRINATSASGKMNDLVIVRNTPISNLYNEPYNSFPGYRITIKDAEKRVLYRESDTSIIFNGENSNVRYVIYPFYSIVSNFSCIVLLANIPLVEKEAVAFLDERYPFLGLENEVYFYQIYYKCIAAVSTNNVLGLNVLYFEYDSDESKDTSDLLVRYEAVIAGIQSIMI